MAMESQGIIIRRMSTAAGSSASSSGLTFGATASTQLTRSDAGSFVTDGFTTGMRFQFPGSTLNTNAYTVASVAATAIGIYETLTTHSTGINVSVIGHAYQTIGSITGFNGPSGSAAVIDITALNSTAKEKQMGLRDEGQISLDVNFDTSAASLHTALRTDRAMRTQRMFDITFTDPGTAASQPSFQNFDAYVTGFSINGSVDNIVKATISLEITSAVKYQAPV